MKILSDFYIAFAIVLIASGGILVVWQLGLRPAGKQLLKIAAILFILGGLVGVACMGYYGSHLMDKGNCPYSEPLVPCPTTPSHSNHTDQPSHAPAGHHPANSPFTPQYRRPPSTSITA